MNITLVTRTDLRDTTIWTLDVNDDDAFHGPERMTLVATMHGEDMLVRADGTHVELEADVRDGGLASELLFAVSMFTGENA